MAKAGKSRVPLQIQHDEACVLTAADTRYWQLLNDEETEALAEGRVTPSFQERARGLLSWKRDQERQP